MVKLDRMLARHHGRPSRAGWPSKSYGRCPRNSSDDVILTVTPRAFYQDYPASSILVAVTFTVLRRALLCVSFQPTASGPSLPPCSPTLRGLDKGP